MSNWRKVFQGLIILAILFGTLGAIVCLGQASAQVVTHPTSVGYMSDSGIASNTGLAADSGQVFWAKSVAWNHPVKKGRDVRRSVAWN
jgi:hypothetical protein